MAIPKKRRGIGEKAAIEKRAKLIKDANEYWKVLQKQWGAKDVRLRFTTSKRKPYAGGYHQEWYDDPSKPFIEVNIPGAKDFVAHSGNPTLTETKKIMRHELAHHRQFLKENAGKEGVGRNPDVHLPTQNERWHGPNFQKQAKQIGGGEQNRPSIGPRNTRKIPVNKAKASRENIRRRKASIKARLGPPSDRKTDIQRARRFNWRNRQA